MKVMRSSLTNTAKQHQAATTPTTTTTTSTINITRPSTTRRSSQTSEENEKQNLLNKSLGTRLGFFFDRSFSPERNSATAQLFSQLRWAALCWAPPLGPWLIWEESISKLWRSTAGGGTFFFLGGVMIFGWG